MEVFSHAKINLSLRLTGRAGERHTYDSVTSAVSLFDRVTLDFTDGKTEIVGVRGLAGVPNRFDHAKTALALMSRYVGSASAARLRITKNIPDRAGLGGSASEAAAIIRLFCREYRISADDAGVRKIAESLGADVPVMLADGYARATGCGETVTAIPSESELCFLAVKSGIVSTAEAFRLSDGYTPAPGDNRELIAALTAGKKPTQSMIVNDLLPAAASLCPTIGKHLDALKKSGAYAVGMTGSGACCFGLFDTVSDCRAASDKIDAEFSAVCRTVLPQKFPGV